MEALRVIVSFTLVCEKEKIDNRIQKRDNSFFIIDTFLALIAVKIPRFLAWIATNSRISSIIIFKNRKKW